MLRKGCEVTQVQSEELQGAPNSEQNGATRRASAMRARPFARERARALFLRQKRCNLLGVQRRSLQNSPLRLHRFSANAELPHLWGNARSAAGAALGPSDSMDRGGGEARSATLSPSIAPEERIARPLKPHRSRQRRGSLGPTFGATRGCERVPLREGALVLVL